MADFMKAHEFTAKWEGGISDHPADRGGYTAYGVCFAFLNDLYNEKAGRAFLASLGIKGPITKTLMIKKIDRNVAAEIFRFYFWDGQKIGELESQTLATVWYDMAVNHGKGGGGRMIQQALNNAEKAKLVVDGVIGPLSLAALKKARGSRCALEALRIRENFYRNLVARRPSQKSFLKGWLNRAADLKRFIARFED